MTPRRPAALLLAGICCAAAGCGESSKPAVKRPASTATASTSALAATTQPKPPSRPAPPPGSLPQTHQLPSSASAAFRAEMAALWSGVRRGSLREARTAFFPELAYAQVKAIADPAADYRHRLLSEFGLDLQAAHGLLGAHAPDAQLLGVHVPEAYAHWVPPGSCFNRIGYYEVPNSRVVYRLGGSEHSFGIASLISWRGVWYVVHLGSVVRSSSGGAVDDPEPGPGMPAPSSTC